MEIPQIVPIDEIIISSRIRKDLGDIPGLANSIKENGLIEPIVLTHDYYQPGEIVPCDDPVLFDHTKPYIKLVAGERRLTALKSLGLSLLVHATHFIWHSELESDDPKKRLLFSAIEMEENVRRKDLSWQEQVLGKQKLLDIMQEIYGPPIQGRPSPSQQRDITKQGFGVNKLAAMLGETPANTSVDLELASLIEKVPSLKNEATREDARRKFTSEAIKVLIAMKSTTKPIDESYATIYQGSFAVNSDLVLDNSIDLVYTDLPYGVDLDSMKDTNDLERGGQAFKYEDSLDSIKSILGIFLHESYRILKNNRFAVFFVGFSYYGEFTRLLEVAGFKYNKIPFIWYKKGGHGQTRQPYLLYGNAYEPAIIAWKGTPRFVRPGMHNVVEIGPEHSKMHMAQQPVELVKRFIMDMTMPDATICDLMCGSGTTGIAALELGRKCILFEQDKAIYDYAKVRIEDTIKKIKGA